MQISGARIMQAGHNYRVDRLGIGWYEQGLVSWVDAVYGSVVGAVDEPGRGEMKAWAGIENGLLAFDCEDCRINERVLDRILDEDDPLEPEDKLCPHAVAVALEAADRGARWYELRKDGVARRPELHKEADRFLKPGRGTLLSRLSEDENGILLQRLVEQRPELTGEIERLAIAQLDKADISRIARRTRRELRAFEPAEIPAYLGETDGELTARYLEPDESGYLQLAPEDILLHYALRPLVADVSRRFSLGAARGARATALGIVKGFYDDRNRDVWTHPLVAEHLGDHVLQNNARMVAEVVAEWDTGLRIEELREVAPEWADRLCGEQ